MKSGTTRSVAVALAGSMVVSTIGIMVVSDARRRSWNDRTESAMIRLATFVEVFRIEYGRYPRSLDEISKSTELSNNSSLVSLLDGEGGAYFTYQLADQSFAIIATNSPRWLDGPKSVHKEFRFGEVVR